MQSVFFVMFAFLWSLSFFQSIVPSGQRAHLLLPSLASHLSPATYTDSRFQFHRSLGKCNYNGFPQTLYLKSRGHANLASETVVCAWLG